MADPEKGGWRNGIRGSLKNYWLQDHEGSTPSPPTQGRHAGKGTFEKIFVFR